MASDLCPTCGTVLAVGEWPWCPHGVPNLGVIDDQLEGGPRYFETMDHDAPFISSKSALKREMDKRGLTLLDRHDRQYFDRQFRQHDERLRDTGSAG